MGCRCSRWMGHMPYTGKRGSGDWHMKGSSHSIWRRRQGLGLGKICLWLRTGGSPWVGICRPPMPLCALKRQPGNK